MLSDDDAPVRHLTADELTAAAATALERHGARPLDARRQAEHLVEAELRGHPSHGIQRLVTLVGRLDAGLIATGGEPALEWTADGALVADGRDGFGPVVADRILDELLARAGAVGIVAAAASRTHHLGMLSPYVERVADRGFIGIVLTSTEALVHPWGGSGALVGTNPIAIGVPSRDGAVSLDMSTGAVSAGRILHYAARGESLPEGWAVDADGHPTSDAAAAAHGAISPFGGAKGYALGLTLGALVGALTGTSFGTAVAGTLDTERPVTKGDVFIVIDPTRFGGDPRDPGLAAYLDEIRASAIDGGTVSVPGDRARRSRAIAVSNGIDVDARSWAKVRELAGEEAE